MAQQGAGEDLCQFFVFSCSVPCHLRAAETPQPLPGSRKAQTGQEFMERLQGKTLVMLDKPFQGHQNTEWCFFLLVQQLYLTSQSL